jgi:hypothetical protein
LKIIAAKGFRIVTAKKRAKKKSPRAAAKKSAARKMNPRPYKYTISVAGVRIANFLTLGHAKQYAQALADKTGRAVRLTA